MKLHKSLIAAASLAAILVIVGCGGGSAAGSGATEGMRVAIDWDDASRVAGTQSVVLRVTGQGIATAYEQIVNRAPGAAEASAVFTGLPEGPVTLTAEAHTESNGTGEAVSTIATTLAIEHSKMKEIALAMVGEIKAIVIPDNPGEAAPGAPVDLNGYAVTAEGKILMLPDEQLLWQVTPDAYGATINENGVLVAAAAGTISVTLTDPGSGEQATVLVDVSNPTTGGGSGQP